MPLELAAPEPETPPAPAPEPEPEPEPEPAQEPESEPESEPGTETELGLGQRRQVRGRWSRRTEPWASDFCKHRHCQTTANPTAEAEQCAHGVFDVTLPVSCERRNQA